MIGVLEPVLDRHIGASRRRVDGRLEHSDAVSMGEGAARREPRTLITARLSSLEGAAERGILPSEDAEAAVDVGDGNQNVNLYVLP